MTKRMPAVAGSFYPANRTELKDMVEGFIPKNVERQRAFGVISPHAGYVYSGAVAGKTFAQVEIPKQCIVLAPNHTGYGSKAAIMTDGAWMTPIGDVPVDSTIANKLLSKCSIIKNDSTAHIAEHSLEVQLPFMLTLQPELTIVPICLSHLRVSECKEIGEAIADLIRSEEKDILVVASSDMNHYESQKRTEKKDNLAIEQVLKMDPEGLINTCSENGITMCGVIPTAVMLFAARKLGKKNAKLIAHQTSGDISGDYDAVVGYAGIIVW
ncbi:MAG: AmmeMemoRadiSam system protein B [Pseudomonadota bacterium]